MNLKAPHGLIWNNWSNKINDVVLHYNLECKLNILEFILL